MKIKLGSVVSWEGSALLEVLSLITQLWRFPLSQTNRSFYGRMTLEDHATQSLWTEFAIDPGSKYMTSWSTWETTTFLTEGETVCQWGFMRRDKESMARTCAEYLRRGQAPGTLFIGQKLYSTIRLNCLTYTAPQSMYSSGFFIRSKPKSNGKLTSNAKHNLKTKQHENKKKKWKIRCFDSDKPLMVYHHPTSALLCSLVTSSRNLVALI